MQFFLHVCTQCNKRGHFQEICRSKDKKTEAKVISDSSSDDGEYAIYDEMCGVHNCKTPQSIALDIDHHVIIAFATHGENDDLTNNTTIT